ncbi:MAG: hypothetical protein RLY57_639 [Candidatus Parcubacteria bacterium]|jgi:diadenosine tetraphosphate (Ap4A) HIT family hydrolase
MKKFPFAIPGIKPADIGVLRNMSTFKQYCATVKTLLANECPFCLINPEINVPLYENDSWMVWHSAFPQRHQSLHLVIPNKRHICQLHELTLADMAHLHDMFQWIHGKFGEQLPGGGLGARFGDVNYNIASVPGHFHWNIQVPNGEGTVALWLAKSPEEIAHADHRATIFEHLRLNGGNLDQLRPNDRDFIVSRDPALVVK